MEIIIVIVIIFVIMMLIGGDTPFLPKTAQEVAAMRAPQQWHCEEVVWDNKAHVINGQFKGTAKLVCDLSAVKGTGVSTLQTILLQDVPDTADEVHSHTYQVIGNTQKANYDMSLKVDDADGEQVTSRGMTVVQSDSKNYLEASYSSSDFKTRGQARYLKGLDSKLRVLKAKDGMYKVTIENTLTVNKPWFVSSYAFEKALKRVYARKLKEKEEEIVKRVANQL